MPRKPLNLTEFHAWLDQELKQRGLSFYTFSKTIGLSHTAFAHTQRSPRLSLPTLAQIADALGYPREVVFQKAGWLPAERPEVQEWRCVLAQLTHEELVRLARQKIEAGSR